MWWSFQVHFHAVTFCLFFYVHIYLQGLHAWRVKPCCVMIVSLFCVYRCMQCLNLFCRGLSRSIFMQLHDVKLEKAHEDILDDSSSDDIRDVPNARYSRTPAGLSPGDRGRTSSGMSSGMQPRSTTPPKIDKRLHQHFVSWLFWFSIDGFYS